MEDTNVLENRGSGIPTMIRAMRQANLEPPRFEDAGTSFRVTFRNHTLMGPDAVAWLNQLAGLPLSDHQRLALVFLRHNDRLTNSDYRRLNWVDVGAATRDLRSLAQHGLIAQHSTGRWTYYTLAVRWRPPFMPDLSATEEKVLAFVREHGSISNAECRSLLRVSRQRASVILSGLKERSVLEVEGRGRWTVYRLTP
jgi:ATP-dependent DNA helicase RecG